MLRIQEHVPLAPLSTFAIGGDARWLVDVHDADELKEACAFATDNGGQVHVLAGGSNTLFSDEGFDGLVVRIADDAVQFEDERVVCGGGATLLSVLKKAAGRGLGGLEKLAGIPGSIGGAVRGNAGAFGMEIKDAVESVETITSRGQVRHFDAISCRFGYRDSIFKKDPTLVILQVTLRLIPATASAIEKGIADTIIEREKKHIQNIKSAGSFFINPIAPDVVRASFEREGHASRGGRVPAGWLLERAGMRGTRVGGATASEHHANYFVNIGNATAHDVRALAQQAKETVFTRDGIILQEEVTVL